METDKLREEFLHFFKNKEHKIFPSDSLVPLDPTVLFTSAGMNQFKPYFLGEKKDTQRASSCQKCLRTGDLERVGKTPYHHTFFEMLGNFSFGDYFKKEAIEFAWEFLTSVLNVKEDRLWVSVYYNDSEAFNIWNNHIGIPEVRIVKLGEKDNFWPASAPELGPDGPCGPCSEIFFDRGKDKGCGRKECNPSCPCGRFVEIWNLVFTQFVRRGKNNLEPLPQKNIDTGMGLERMAAVLQGKYSNFEIDIFQPLIMLIRDILDIQDDTPDTISSINAIADHSRAVTFAISDGVFPSNEERGYVIRKLIRKALWEGYSLGHKEPFVYKLVDKCAELMNKPYPEVFKDKDKISEVIRIEEDKFLSTIEGAKSQFYLVSEGLKKSGEQEIDGASAFKLYDTYGFPLELTKALASSSGLEVDEENFYALLKKQRDNSRKKSMFADAIFTKGDYSLETATKFTGYGELKTETVISAIFKGKEEVSSLKPGEEGVVILRESPFYAESGGQLADRGIIKTGSGGFSVRDVQKSNNAILHMGKVLEGEISREDCTAEVDYKRRKALMRAHTGTHLLQAALRAILGKHITQQGSLVDEDRLRFDFSHFKALTEDELSQVERRVNHFIIRGDNVVKEEMGLNEAKKEGALAFFKDKYKDVVRVISIADYSKELCGGTHVCNTSEVGLFYITNEFSVSSGVRRIEALVGNKAVERALLYKSEIARLSNLLRVKEADIIRAVNNLESNVKTYKDKAESLEKKLVSLDIEKLAGRPVNAGNAKLFIYEFKDKNYQHLLYAVDIIRKKDDDTIIFLSSVNERKNIFVLAVTETMAQKFNIAKFIPEYKDALGLKGGGRGITAQGVLLKKLDKDSVEKAIRNFLNKT